LELDYSAKILGQDFNNNELREAEVNKLKYQSEHYNSVVISDTQGRLINFSPNILHIDKSKIQHTQGIIDSLHKKSTYISSPYFSVQKNMIAFISERIFDKSSHYQCLFVSSNCLKEKNVINRFLTTYKNYNNSYMYVINCESKKIFHLER